MARSADPRRPRRPLVGTVPRRRASVARIGVLLWALFGVLFGAGCSDDSGSGDGGPDPGDDTSTTAPGTGVMWSGPTPTSEDMADQDAAELDATVDRVMSTTGGQVPGMWVGVWDSGKGRHLTAWGEASVDGTPAEADQSGRIGSLTATFTTAAVLRLVDEGRLSLDDRIQTLLPDLAEAHPDVANITVEELLGMTSGIPDYAGTDWFLARVVDDPTKVWEPGEIIEEVLSRGDLEPIGTPAWSATNLLVLGEVLEELDDDGRGLATILTTLATDAGLADTAMPEPADASLPEPASHGYVNEPGASELAAAGATVEAGTDVSAWSPSWMGAAGAMHSTLEDLGAWAATGLGTALLGEELGGLRISETSELPGLGPYGLGLQVLGGDWIGHVGQIIGWEAVAAYDTSTGDVFVAVVNEAASLPAAVAVAEEVYPELGQSLAATTG